MHAHTLPGLSLQPAAWNLVNFDKRARGGGGCHNERKKEKKKDWTRQKQLGLEWSGIVTSAPTSDDRFHL